MFKVKASKRKGFSIPLLIIAAAFIGSATAAFVPAEAIVTDIAKKAAHEAYEETQNYINNAKKTRFEDTVQVIKANLALDFADKGKEDVLKIDANGKTLKNGDNFDKLFQGGYEQAVLLTVIEGAELEILNGVFKYEMTVGKEKMYGSFNPITNEREHHDWS